jgi:hypothetical protein
MPQKKLIAHEGTKATLGEESDTFDARFVRSPKSEAKIAVEITCRS